MTNASDPHIALLRAVGFAAERHCHQRRKGAEASPYVNHPIAVAILLADVAHVTDVATLQAALLHDTVEDTETTPEEIEQAFGTEVRDLVLELTDDVRLSSEERRVRQIEGAHSLSQRAKLIKVADKISNVADIARAPPAGWSVERRVQYLDWADEVVTACRGTNGALERRFFETLQQSRELLAAV